MGVHPDHWIVRMARQGMIEPFQESQVREGTISYGVSSYGYDFRVGRRFKLLRWQDGNHLDPKAVEEERFEDREGEECLIPARSFVLAQSFEYFRIPRDVLALCTGKSTYARCGIIVNVTPLEPEWEGYITMSISNTAPVPVKIHAGEGIGQVLFLRAEDSCRISYRDKKGKYQAQRGIVLPKVEGSGSR